MWLGALSTRRVVSGRKRDSNLLLMEMLTIAADLAVLRIWNLPVSINVVEEVIESLIDSVR